MKNLTKKMGFVWVLLMILAGVTSCQKPKEPTNELIDQIDQVVEKFMDNYVDNYFNDQLDTFKMDYHVATVLKTLGKENNKYQLSNYMTKTNVETYYNNLTYEQPSDVFKAVINCHAIDANYDKAKEAMSKITTVDAWNITYALLVLNKTKNNDALENELLTKITVINESDYRDADYAGIALMALANHPEVAQTNLFNLITPNLTKEGVSSWGTVNACSTAYVIMGLIANDIDPTSSDYTIEGTNLIEALLAFSKDGAFKYSLDQDIDLDFATPQALMALVTYREYVTNGIKILF